MPLSKIDFDLINKYADDELSDVEQFQFKARMQDVAFRSEVQHHEATVQAVKEMLVRPLKDELKQQWAEVDELEASTGLMSKRYWAYGLAAGLIGILIVASIWMQRYSNSPDELYARFYKPYPALAQTRGQELAIGQGVIDYQAGLYELSARELETAIRNTDEASSRAYLELLLGNCYMNLNQWSQASKIFESIIQSGETIAAQHAQWFYSLSLLKQGELVQCRAQLHVIVASQSVYSIPAAQLLDDL